MKALTALNIAVGVIAAISFAAIAPPASAEGVNPYLPVPAASSETADHGQGSYCSKPFLLGTCEAPDMSSNGYGEGDKLGLPDREGRHHVDPPKKI